MPSQSSSTQRPSLPRLRKLRNTLYEGLLEHDLVDIAVSGRGREELVEYILSFIHKPGDFTPGLEDIGDGSYFDEVLDDECALSRRERSVGVLLDDFLGERLSGDRLRTFLIKVCGQYEELRAGALRIGGWDSTVPSRSLLRMLSLQRSPSRRGRKYHVTMEAYTGIAAGTSWTSVMTGGRIQQVLRDIGAPKYKKYSDFDISGMWLIATVYVEDGRLLLDDLDVGASQKTYNKRLASGRLGPCLLRDNPRSGKQCGPCPVGQERCPLSRFEKSYSEIRMCAYRHRGLFLPGSVDTVCLSCQIKGK
jgi:hypothetical protein